MDPFYWVLRFFTYYQVYLRFQIFLEYLSEGAEHGHSSSNSKVKLPWVLFFSLCLHAFVERIPMGTEEALV